MYNWAKDLETGNAVIDSQHKQWLDALNRMLDACTHFTAIQIFPHKSYPVTARRISTVVAFQRGALLFSP